MGLGRTAHPMKQPTHARPSARIFAGVLSLAACSAARTVAAQQTETDGARALAARRALLDQAQRARDAGDHQAALDAAARALELQNTPSVRLFVGTEQLAVRRYSEALANGRSCRGEALRDAALRNRETIATECGRVEAEAQRHVGAVDVRVPTDRIDPMEAATLVVRVNGALLPQILWGQPFTVSEGDVAVAVSRDDVELFQQGVRVAAGETVPVAVPPESLRTTSAPVADPSVIRITIGGPRVRARALAPPPPTPRRGPGAAPWIVVGVGAGVAVAGAVLYGVSHTMARCSENSDGVCDTQQRADEVSANAAPLAITGDALMVTGGLAVAGGLLWAILAPRGSAQESTLRANSLRIEPSGNGLRLRF